MYLMEPWRSTAEVGIFLAVLNNKMATSLIANLSVCVIRWVVGERSAVLTNVFKASWALSKRSRESGGVLLLVGFDEEEEEEEVATRDKEVVCSLKIVSTYFLQA